MYVFAMSAKTLWSIVKINRREEDKDKGYQRTLSASRVKKIAKYLNEGHSIPGAILVSFDKSSVSANGSQITITNDRDAGWVIDGQHRLAGAHEADNDIEVPVVAYTALKPDEQIELFVTINREQKGVPTSLYYDLLKHLPGRLTETEILQDRANDLATALRQDDNSPFYQRIRVTTSPKQGQLSSTNVVRKLVPHLRRDGRLAQFNDEERAGILNNVYKALEQVFPEEYSKPDSVFMRTIGFGAILDALPVILDVTFRIAGTVTARVGDLVNTFTLVRSFDFGAWRQMGTGSAAEKQAADDLRTQLEDEAKAAKARGIAL